MLRQSWSKTATRNAAIVPMARGDDEDNLQWGARAVIEMGTGGVEGWTHLVLLGGSDTMAFRLRQAQSHLRSDMLPSYWSESLLVNVRGTDVLKARALHVPLLQPTNGALATISNGVVERPLKDFADPARWPNVAVIAVPVPQEQILEKVETFKRSRATLDALEHILRWLAYAWGVARTPNPLSDGIGMPSACMLETACAAANFDLTPGLESRASCPEAIWVAALHWHEYFQSFTGHKPCGRSCTPHYYPIVEEAAASPKRRR
jgi:hypothetical protein